MGGDTYFLPVDVAFFGGRYAQKRRASCSFQHRTNFQSLHYLVPINTSTLYRVRAHTYIFAVTTDYKYEPTSTAVQQYGPHKKKGSNKDFRLVYFQTN